MSCPLGPAAVAVAVLLDVRFVPRAQPKGSPEVMPYPYVHVGAEVVSVGVCVAVGVSVSVYATIV